MRARQIIAKVIIIICLSLPPLFPQGSSLASSQDLTASQQRAENLLNSMSPEEKVGQLFLVTFSGTDVSPDTPIYRLIVNHHIGGVILRRENGNIQSGENALVNTRNMINALQWAEYDSSITEQQGPGEEEPPASTYIPLLIGLSQEGDYSSHTTLVDGVTPIPSQMAIGATWDHSLAEEAGNVLGQEVTALGVNLLLGPSLDVLENPQRGELSDLGVRSFGGDPYWVGRMGQAYIKGVHEGSDGRLLTIGKYFPGLGSADRLPEEEVATVRKSLEQLKQIELAPFFAVTGNAPSPETTVDGLLTSHIRYQGLQGNIRSTTRPISLDPQAFDLLMNLETFQRWRTNGGLMVSDSLGSQALRQLYDPTGQTFNARQVALDAFFAGNDILYLGNFVDSNQPDSFTTIKNTLEFFAQKYQDDQTFAARVDQSVLRILNKKLDIYNYFYISQVTPAYGKLSSVGENDQLGPEIARNAATLISPGISELDNTLPNPPQLTDRIVIISDTESEIECEDCTTPPSITQNALAESILRLYGPQAGRQVLPGNITSFTHRDITTMLDFPEESEGTEQVLSRADWIIIAMLNVSPDRDHSRAFHRLLAERQDLIRETKVVVYSFNAPYYLDATNISKINAYYGLYSKLPSFLDVAARILFKEIPNPPGDLPVSVPGVGYDLISATSPDPEQSFSIYLGEAPLEEEEAPEEQPNTTPTFPVYNIGDVVAIETGIILDHNGHPVPDGTPVQFVVSSEGETNYLPLVETKDGQASTSFLIEQGKNLQIHAISSPAESEFLRIQVSSPEEQTNEEPFNTPTATDTPPTETATPSSFIATTSNTQKIPPDPINWKSWSVSLFFTFALSIIVYQLGAAIGQVRWGVRWGFATFLGGILIYNYLALDLPGSQWILSPDASIWKIGGSALLGGLIGWGFSFLIQKKTFGGLFKGSKSPS